jgi:glycosyltransferase involved in cell wall biosynthesis
MFDYHMAGLAVIATNLPGLADVVNRSGAGLLYEPGNPSSLAQAVLTLRSSSELLGAMQYRARRFAMESANLELELARIREAMRFAFENSQSIKACCASC